jgi:hypothetical protein
LQDAESLCAKKISQLILQLKPVHGHPGWVSFAGSVFFAKDALTEYDKSRRLPNSSDGWTEEHALKTSKEEKTHGKMSLSKEVDISKSLDTAETRGVSGDPIMRKLRTTLQDGG